MERNIPACFQKMYVSPVKCQAPRGPCGLLMTDLVILGGGCTPSPFTQFTSSLNSLSSLLLKTHLSQLLPLDNNQAPGLCQRSKYDCSSCLRFKIYCFFRCCCCLFRQSHLIRKGKSTAAADQPGQCLGSNVCGAALICLSGHSLSCLRESGHTPKSIAWTQAAVPDRCLLVALLQLSSKHGPIGDSLCSVVTPHTPRCAPQISTSG